MRMKMFAAESFEAAKAAIFAEMGADAVILSEREVDGGVEVRAAINKLNGGLEGVVRELGHGRGIEDPLQSRARDALLWHGASKRFAKKITTAAFEGAQKFDGPEEAISAGLSNFATCDPLSAGLDHDIILVGPPGHGRTSVAAKLTRRAAIVGKDIHPLAADLDGTAGGEQLAAYLELEKDNIRTAASASELFAELKLTRQAGRTSVIDLPSILPFDTEDMMRLGDLVGAIGAEPVLVLSAEGHPDDIADAAKAFSRAGVNRAIVTKLDVVRRRGGVFSALIAAKISFSHLAVSPFIGGGLVPATPDRVAKLLIEDQMADVIALKGAA